MLLLLHFVEQPDGLPVVGGRAELPVDDEEQRLLVKRMDVDQPEIAVGPYPHLCGRAAFCNHSETVDQRQRFPVAECRNRVGADDPVVIFLGGGIFVFVVGDAADGAQGSQFEEQFVREVVQNEDLETFQLVAGEGQAGETSLTRGFGRRPGRAQPQDLFQQGEVLRGVDLRFQNPLLCDLIAGGLAQNAVCGDQRVERRFRLFGDLHGEKADVVGEEEEVEPAQSEGVFRGGELWVAQRAEPVGFQGQVRRVGIDRPRGLSVDLHERINETLVIDAAEPFVGLAGQGFFRLPPLVGGLHFGGPSDGGEVAAEKGMRVMQFVIHGSLWVKAGLLGRRDGAASGPRGFRCGRPSPRIWLCRAAG